MSVLSVGQYERMLNLAVAALREQDPGRLWDPVVAELLRTCGGQFVFLKRDEQPGGEGAMRFWAADAATAREPDAAVRERIHRACPLADHYASSGDRAPRTAAEILGERAWRASTAARLLRDTLGTDHLLGLPLPDASRPFRYFLVCRSGPAFTTAQLAYARRIQPLLEGVDRQAQLLECWHAASATPPGGRNAPAPAPDSTAAEHVTPGGDLTPRELTVLGLLADALTAAVIGRRLGISVHTAQKHIQSIYRKLGTRDRVATVLRAQTHGLIPGAAGVPDAGPGGRGRGHRD
ncbi:LuxR C-terminal-related transcriptional regulator [Streptomyces sp. PmtG]